MSILPITFLERGSISIRGIGGVTNSGGRINGSGDCMTGNMCGRHRLPCGTGSGAGRIILCDLTRSRMGVKRSLAYIGHPENARSCPRTYRFDGFSRTIITRFSLFKIWQHTLGTVRRPDRQFSVVASACKLFN